MSTTDTLHQWMTGLGRGSLALLYPRKCALCETALDEVYASHGVGLGDAERARQALCERCETFLRPLERPFCEICSEPLGGLETEATSTRQCENCREIRWRLDGAVCALRGTTGALELVHAFKYGRQAHLAPLLGWLLRDAGGDARLQGREFEALVPVPLHPIRRRQRGFNQAHLLAEQLRLRFGPRPLPVREILRRVRDTGSQTRLSRAGRQRNLRGAFELRRAWRSRVAGRSFLLVDDVFTTGSTLDECARVLKQAGAAEVWAVALVRAGRR